jgi:AcrR family transcriptional regulator
VAEQAKQREPLSAERIEIAALELIEAQGLASFSLRKLAARLGCEAMSIYHYFPSKGHLMDALVDRVVAEFPPLPDDRLPWRERLRQVARNWRRVFVSRPNFFIFMATHRLNTPAALRMLDRLIGMFGEGGMDREAAVRLFRAIGYYLMGAGLDETAGYARGPSTVKPLPDDVMKRDFPNVHAAAPYFRPSEWDRTFELGLDLMLRGVAQLVEEEGSANDRRDAARR